jgi:phenylpropionate dioxygenase-like ring-hydroxylating dioxygenase large terminal subunit
MGLLKALNKVRGGYPGGWREYARGYQKENTPPFMQSTDPKDRRSQIPSLGLREYWYPALPAKDVGWKKPVGLRLLGEDITLFRDKNGEIQALWDYCPHRGVYLSWGDCFWKGYLSCPYHGATFNGDGECVEFITEGPDSKMVGQLKAKKFPTRTIRGLVFVWMGEGEPAPIEEDVPPEFFEDNPETIVLHTIRYWDCNWLIAMENNYDAHNAFYVHRNSLVFLRTRYGGRIRTPQGYRAKTVNNKAVVPSAGAEQYYADETGKVPYQLYYPRVDGYWPQHRWRLLWAWVYDFFSRRNQKRPIFQTPEEWQGPHLPGMLRIFFGGPSAMYTRWTVPVERDLSRVFYFRSMRIKSRLGRLWERVTYRLYRDWFLHYNFSEQDYDAMRSTRYHYPEYLSATDSVMVGIRRLVAQHARGIERTGDVEDDALENEERVNAGSASVESETASGSRPPIHS